MENNAILICIFVKKSIEYSKYYRYALYDTRSTIIIQDNASLNHVQPLMNVLCKDIPLQ